MPETGTLSLKADRFALAIANGAKKPKALEIAGYGCKTPNAIRVQASKLITNPLVCEQIKTYQTEIMLAQGLTDERIIGNIAEIAFDKDNNNVDRNRALETLCRQRGMLTDNINNQPTEQPALSESERDYYKEQAKGLLKLRKGTG